MPLVDIFDIPYFGAGYRNRTGAYTLEGCRTTIIQIPHLLVVVDPTGLAPVSLRVKGRMLLYTPRAQIHHLEHYNKKDPLRSLLVTRSVRSVIYGTFYL